MEDRIKDLDDYIARYVEEGQKDFYQSGGRFLPPIPNPNRPEPIHWERVMIWEWAILAFAILYGVPQVLYAMFHSF